MSKLQIQKYKVLISKSWKGGRYEVGGDGKFGWNAGELSWNVWQIKWCQEKGKEGVMRLGGME